ncbi:hypothetical protein FRC00_011732 [Tulasnella sp. 408]|nr:hypothetical protein FRC00_011732 [Tulasnella sp. 408]
MDAATKLVIHIEVLFAAIDELERAGAEGLSQNIYVENLFNTAFDLIKTLSGAKNNSLASNSVRVDSQRKGAIQALLALTPSPQKPYHCHFERRAKIEA